MNNILNAREERAKRIQSWFRGNPICVVKANIPGTDKNMPSAYFLVRLFRELVKKRFSVLREQFFESADGPYQIIEIGKTNEAKQALIAIEENHPLGRCMDLDLYLKKDKSESRRDYQRPFRKCLICEEDAITCMRRHTHSTDELHRKMNEMILDFLKAEIADLLEDAIDAEARLENKFGLVTFSSSGSHPDMDYPLMVKSRKAIMPFLMEMFACGYLYTLDTAFLKARKLGIMAEQAMKEATNGVNTYKGLIFASGLVLIAMGNCFRDGKTNLYEKIKMLASGLLSELEQGWDTFGKQAYKKYGITGIRGEAYRGFPGVKEAVKQIIDDSESTLTMVLIRLIERTEDTVLLKRSGSIEKYEKYRLLIGGIKEYDPDRIRRLTEECIRENLSFGGSADLLAVSIFIRKTEERFKIDYEED